MKNVLILLLSGIILSSYSCKKKDDNVVPNNNNNTTVTINSSERLTGTLNGTSVNYNSDNNAAGSHGSDGSLSAYPDPSYFKYSSSIMDNDLEITYFTIAIGTLCAPNGGYPEDTSFVNFLSKGVKPFSANATNGVELTALYDNKFWTTSNGSGNQDGKSFKIDDVKAEKFYGSQYVKFKASFSCNLYDESGNKIVFDNGVYIGYIENM